MSIDILKYENAILYLCKKSGGKVEGMTKLYKLLYYIDFGHFEYKESMKTITGDEFKHRDNGPVPISCAAIINEMIKVGKLQTELVDIGYDNPMTVFVALNDPDTSVFDEDEIYILEYVIKKYGRLSGTELSRLTHAEAPYVATDSGETIPFELGFYRGTDFSNALV